MATTPSPPSDIRTPPAPRYGPCYDQYEPYDIRRSTRIAGRRSFRGFRPSSPGSLETETTTQTDTGHGKEQKGSGFRALSPPESSRPPPRKKTMEGHSRPNSNTSDPFTTTSLSLSSKSLSRESQAIVSDKMLPTPAKTPKKKAVRDPGSTVRSLFSAELSAGRRKRRQKPAAFSLESFENDPNRTQPDIEIYTDSRDRIPELDESEGNPFYVKPSEVSASRTPTRTPKHPKVEEERHNETIDKNIHRDDGMFYVFRGKRFFRKFEDEPEDERDDDDDDSVGLFAVRPDLIDSSAIADCRRPVRSSFKPQVLFPDACRSSKRELISESDEEAATDIEDDDISKDEADGISHTPDVDIQQDPATPPNQSNPPTPPSPDTTTRTPRSRTRREAAERNVTPTARETRRKAISPFAGWQRKKRSPPGEATPPRKRDAGIGSPSGPMAKRTRSGRSTIRP